MGYCFSSTSYFTCPFFCFGCCFRWHFKVHLESSNVCFFSLVCPIFYSNEIVPSCLDCCWLGSSLSSSFVPFVVVFFLFSHKSFGPCSQWVLLFFLLLLSFSLFCFEFLGFFFGVVLWFEVIIWVIVFPLHSLFYLFFFLF